MTEICFLRRYRGSMRPFITTIQSMARGATAEPKNSVGKSASFYDLYSCSRIIGRATRTQDFLIILHEKTYQA
jgi:hypothetical protein